MPVIPFQIAPRQPYKPTPRVQDPAYLAWIRTQPCAVSRCHARYIEAAHTGPRGLSTKADDRQAIPLCPEHHQHGKHSLHKLGRRLFEGFWKLDLTALIRELNDWYEMEGKTA